MIHRFQGAAPYVSIGTPIMPNMSFVVFGQYGVVTGIDAFDLPLQSLLPGVNIRFVGAHVERAPILGPAKPWRLTALERFSPRSSPTGTDDVFVGYLDGSGAITPSTETDKSIASYTPADADVAFTNTTLARVLYINREGPRPWAYLPEATQFTALTNWDSSWRCKILRSYNFSHCLNMTKAGLNIPPWSNTSDFPTDGEPSSWGLYCSRDQLLSEHHFRTAKRDR